MATTTTNYSFNKPDVDGDEDVWGDLLNDNWDSVDTNLQNLSTEVDGRVKTNGDEVAITEEPTGGLSFRTLNDSGTFIIQVRSKGGTPRMTVAHGAPELKGDSSGWNINGQAVYHEGNFDPNFALDGANMQDGSITGVKLADDSITGVKLANDSVHGTKLQDKSVYGTKIADGGVYSENLSGGSGMSTWVSKRIADFNQGQVGSYIMGRNEYPEDRIAGETIRGGGLSPSTVDGFTQGSTRFSGTWQAMGRGNGTNRSNNNDSDRVTLWLRIA